MPNRTLSLPITELDFDQIKENLKAYLSTTDEFKDFDYEGSGINVLLDLLAYNTHYTAMYANMLVSESFIESAVLRRSVVSLAKNLGYVPASKNAATAVVDLIMGTTSGVPNTIPQGTKFTASKDGSAYSFATTIPYAVDKSSVPYKVKGMNLRQGTYKSASFIYDSASNSKKFEILSDKIDKSLIQVYVMASPSDLGSIDLSWKENTDYLELTPTSKVYFVNENYRGNYEISFGDGIIGAKPDEKNYVVVIYFDTEGFLANDIGNLDTETLSSFTFNGVGGNDFDASVVTITPSFGGAEKDGTEQIRYVSPKYYQSNDRAVTVNDYESIILRQYPAAGSVRVWGGEENDPPAYGKVFIAILPKNALVLSDGEKESLKSTILDKKKVVSIVPEIVDPDFTYVEVDCFATFDSTKAVSAESNVREAILAAIRNYSVVGLGNFGVPFRYSTLSRIIDLSSGALVSNRITTRITKQLVPFEVASNYKMDFGVALKHEGEGCESIVTTSRFFHRDSDNRSVECFIEDDGRGTLMMYTIQNDKKVLVRNRIGTIDYQTGKVELLSFNPTGTGTFSYIKFTVIPDQRYDIIPKRNQILLIDASIPGSVNVILNDAAARTD